MFSAYRDKLTIWRDTKLKPISYSLRGELEANLQMIW